LVKALKLISALNYQVDAMKTSALASNALRESCVSLRCAGRPHPLADLINAGPQDFVLSRSWRSAQAVLVTTPGRD
jgi:hypothetical protein